eukprot:140457-Chlamydomonas_euryale.AAC.1
MPLKSHPPPLPTTTPVLSYNHLYACTEKVDITGESHVTDQQHASQTERLNRNERMGQSQTLFHT